MKYLYQKKVRRKLKHRKLIPYQERMRRMMMKHLEKARDALDQIWGSAYTYAQILGRSWLQIYEGAMEPLWKVSCNPQIMEPRRYIPGDAPALMYPCVIPDKFEVGDL